MTGTVLLTGVDVLLLEALAAHRVLTTDQAAQVARLPMSTANYRLNRLRRAALVTRKRPPARTGTAPLHWWLTSQGRRRIGVPGRVPAAWSSDLFLAHTVATAAVPLALDRHGRSVGLRLLTWQREPREAWSTMNGRLRLTPDGYALVRLDTEQVQVPLLVEVDRGTMAPARLREKTRMYLRYAADGAWRDRHPMCPVLLVLTTSEHRADTMLAAAARDRSRLLGPTGELLVGVCEQVETIEHSITEPVWRADHDDDGDAARTQLRTLTEVLSYRVSTEQHRLAAEGAAHAEQEQAEIEDLGRRLFHTRYHLMQDHLGRGAADPEDRPRQVLSALLNRDERHVVQWVQGSPALARELTDALDSRHAPLPNVTVAKLISLHRPLLTDQIRTACQAIAAAAVGDPRLRRIAESLAHGYLVPGWLLDDLATPLSFADCQDELLAGYPERRDQAVDATLAERRRRRGPGRARLLAEYDVEHLRTCLCCGLHQEERERVGGCRGCDGTLGVRYDPAGPARTSSVLQAFLDGEGLAP